LNNSTRNFKMKKLLIATTALVATAGMAAADITITGHAAAGIHSGLDDVTTTTSTTDVAADGVYSNAGVAFALSGATDNGISFSASVDVMAGNKVDQGDFEYDGADDGAMDLGAVSMTGTFGTLTFDDAGIDNLYNDAYTAADVSYSTTVGAVSLTVAHDTSGAADANSMSAGYTASGMGFTLLASDGSAGTSASVAVSYALNDTVSVTGKTDQVAGAESVQTITASTTLNGVSVALSSANNSTWDVDLGYTAGGFALTYGVDETDGWTATASSALGGGATFAAGVDSNDSMYAGVSFAF
jgi:outer membrane protein OmpU